MYEKILEFYKVALEILSKKGVKLMMQMVWETDRLPNIVQDFLRYSDTLRKLIDKATFEIVEDIRSMLYDQQSKFFIHLKLLHTFSPGPSCWMAR